MKPTRILLTLALTPTLALAQEPPVDEAQVKKLIDTANEVQKEVEALRGLPFKRPVEKGVHSADQLREFIKKKLFEEELGGGELERQQWMLTSLGFLPPGTDLAKTYVDVLLSQVGGFYDPDREAFFMMEKAAGYGEFVNRMMIAHELTHALDDQYYPLNPLMKERQDEHDAGFAVGAVIEGSATALMYRWAPKYGRGFDQSELKKAMKREMEQAKILLEAPPYFSTLVARYMAGMAFLTRGRGLPALLQMESGVKGEVDAALKDVPVSSEQILHPEKYWDSEQIDLPVVIANGAAFTDAIAKAVDGEVVDQDTLGEIHVALLGRPSTKKLNMGLMMSPAYWTNRAARGWGGDRVFLLKKGDAKGIVWITLWDEAADAEEFEAAYSKHYAEATGFDAAREGRCVVFAYGFAKDVGARRLLELTGRAAELKQGDADWSSR